MNRQAMLQVFLVPKSAVVTTTERKYVIVATDNIANWVEVSEGNQRGDSVEVFGQCSKGDQVAANADYQVKNGMQLNQ